MKKLNKKSLIILLCIFTLSSCLTSTEIVNNAKKDMGIIKNENPKITKKQNDIIKEKVIIQEAIKKDINKNIKIESLTKNTFIEIDNINYYNFLNGEGKISGRTLKKVNKIEVAFSNSTSNFPNDLFELRQFSPGDKIFSYNAHTAYKVLDFGINEYIITAYSGGEVSKLKVTINVKTKEENKKDLEKNQASNKKIKLNNYNLPTGGEFGHPISLGENGFTYSDISGLEINKYSFTSEVTCDNITEFLKKKIDTWFYWNTCKNILLTKTGEKSKGISIFIIRLDGDNYYYEKHFLDFQRGLYGSYEIEKGKGVDKNTISDKNTELKEKNKDILNINIVNNLFKEILK